VLASGDPNFFGIADLMYRYFDKQELEVLPGTTAFQSAFARIKEPWGSAFFISIHGRDMSGLDRVCREQGTFVVYCGGRQTPDQAARYLLERDSGLKSCSAWVFENLGTRREKITGTTLGSVRKRSYSSLAMMIIRQDRPQKTLPVGIPDSMFSHERSMITKCDIRLMSIARLQLHQSAVMWDIGAGCGSVSIEAAHLNPALRVFSVERRRARYKDMRKNVADLGTKNVTPVLGTAPGALKNLPSPDCIFIGGSGGGIHDILAYCTRRQNRGGRIVMNCVTVETLADAVAFFRSNRCVYSVTSVQLSRTEYESYPGIMRAENPVFIITAHLRSAGS
jgi:precorrin-6Y C5,15-methyltransferase (decarboxylating)